MTARCCGAVIVVLTLGFAASISHAGPPAAAPTVDCESRSQTIGPSPPARPSDLMAGPVIFRGGKYWADEPRSSFEPRRPGGMVPVKMPFVVTSGHPATVTLAPGDRRRAQIIVGLDRIPRGLRGTEVRFDPCSPEAEVADVPVGRRTVFVGGFRIPGPMCLDLSVLPDGAADPIDRRIAFGHGSCRSHRR